MNPHASWRTFLMLLVLSLSLLACNLLQQQAPAAEAPPPAQAPPSAAPQSSSDTGTAGGGAIQQWASEAVASSEYSSPDYSASQATGQPNTPECGDISTAWASASQDTVEWLNLYFKVPVYPSDIRIIETYYPDQVAKVELIDMQGQYVSVYTGQPKQVDAPCPFTLSIPVNQKDLLVQGVRLTIDQSVIKNWNEIDAVEIIGVPGEGVPVRPVTP